MHEGGCHAHDIVVADFVIVGAGTAGAPLAKLLTDDGCVSAHVIEGGERRNDDPNVLSSLSAGVVTDLLPELHWFYPANARPFPVGANLVLYTEGRMWGGSSGHNYLLAVRGTPFIYDEWARRANNGTWAYVNVLPAMRYLETYRSLFGEPVNPAERGTDGPLFITQGAGVAIGDVPMNPVGPFATASATVGAPYSPDYNDRTQGVYVVGDGQFYVLPTGTFDPTRSWAASAFLDPSVVEVDEDGNGVGVDRQLFIDSEAVAIRLLFDDDLDDAFVDGLDAQFGLEWSDECSPCRGRGRSRCVCDDTCDDASLVVRGVRYIAGDRIVDAIARRKVVLSAGAIGDVLVLERSGIGPAALLNRLGIRVRLDQPLLGTRAQNHFGAIVTLPNPTGEIINITGFLPGEGSGPEGPRAYQFLGGTDLFGTGDFQFLLSDLTPSAVSTVELRARAFPSDPLVTFNHMMTPEDQADAVAALKQMGRLSIAISGQLTNLPPRELYPAAEFAAFGGLAPDDSALLAYFIEAGFPLNHISGTALMGESIEDGVVDGNLDVFGVCNLSIADNAVVPFIEDGNTAYQAYVIGLIKAKLEGAPVPF